MRELREVYYVDGVRSAFGRAGPQGVFWNTRADDIAVKLVRELLRRNDSLPTERIDDVAFAATAQVGDQGLTLEACRGRFPDSLSTGCAQAR